MEPVAPHPAVQAWITLQSDHSAPTRITVLKNNRKSAVYRLHGVGPSNSAVIAKRADRDTGTIERLIYEEILPHLPVSTPRFFGHVDETESAFCWLFLEDAGRAQYSVDERNHRALAAKWLGVMHTSASIHVALGGRLPSRGPEHYFDRLRGARETVLGNLDNSLLNADGREVLEGILSQFEHLESRWPQVVESCSSMPSTLVHGDLGTKNVRFRRSKGGLTFLPFDWEAAGWGPPAVDLAQFTADTVSPDMLTYLSVIAEAWPQLRTDDVFRLERHGVIFRLLDAIYWGSYGLEREPRRKHEDAVEIVKWTMRDLNTFKDLMAGAIQAVKRAE